MTDMNTSYIQFGGLTLTRSDGLPPRFMLLGYSLRLSPSEGAILFAILTADPHRAPSAAELASVLSADRPVSENQVSVLVGRINRKAAFISGRRLIVGVSHRGYRVNPYM
jgi:DNA-binding response OmpR family regulator